MLLVIWIETNQLYIYVGIMFEGVRTQPLYQPFIELSIEELRLRYKYRSSTLAWADIEGTCQQMSVSTYIRSTCQQMSVSTYIRSTS